MTDYEGRNCYVEGYSRDDNDTWTFIKWGQRKAFTEGNDCFPVDSAIVEQDGNVIEVDPSDIRFVD